MPQQRRLHCDSVTAMARVQHPYHRQQVLVLQHRRQVPVRCAPVLVSPLLRARCCHELRGVHVRLYRLHHACHGCLVERALLTRVPYDLRPPPHQACAASAALCAPLSVAKGLTMSFPTMTLLQRRQSAVTLQVDAPMLRRLLLVGRGVRRLHWGRYRPMQDGAVKTQSPRLHDVRLVL